MSTPACSHPAPKHRTAEAQKHQLYERTDMNTDQIYAEYVAIEGRGAERAFLKNAREAAIAAGGPDAAAKMQGELLGHLLA